MKRLTKRGEKVKIN